MSLSGHGSQCQGWLSKWAGYAKGYRERWFILQGEYLSYYPSKTSKADLTTCKGSINLINAIIVREGMDRVRITKEGKEPFFLKTTSEAEMSRWVEAISKHLSQDVTCKTKEEHQSDEFYGVLIPSLAFTTCTDHLKLNTMQAEDATLFWKISDGVQWCASMGIVDLFAPGATMYIKIVGSLYPSVFSYFKEQIDIEQGLVDLKIENALLGHALVDMKTDIGVIEDRFRQMVNENTSPEARKMEVVTAVSLCKKILNCFLNKGHVFNNHAMVLAPSFVGFSNLYVCVAQVAVMLAPHYKDEIKVAMEELAGCMEEFKQKVILIRLGALAGFEESMAAKAMSQVKSVLPLPVALIDSSVSKYFDVNKISDNMYPLPGGGFREQTAFDRTGKYDGSGYREYRDTIQALYASYFDNAIRQIRALKFDITFRQEDMARELSSLHLNLGQTPPNSAIATSHSLDSPKNPLPYPSQSLPLVSPENFPKFPSKLTSDGSAETPLPYQAESLPLFASQLSQDSVGSNTSKIGFLGFDALH